VIARTWTARATAEGARAYCAYFSRALVPALARLAGHRGALVLDRPVGDAVEITVITFWDSTAAISAFAGEAPERAVVEPEARAVLTSFDSTVRHHTVALDSFATGLTIPV